jgi:nucleotide-binding universal stress UspA family protein
MYEKILVPLDGSELAELALPYAEELSGRLGSEVTLIYVSELSKDPYQHMHQFYIQKIAEATQQNVQRYSERLDSRRATQVNSDILLGNPADRIVEYADKEDIGLIIMSTHGRTGIKRWTLGNVADKVVRATKRPVFLIRAKGDHPDVRDKGILRRALVPLDESRGAEAVIPYIEELAFRIRMEVILLRVLASGYVSGSDYVVLTGEQVEQDKATAVDYLNRVAARLKGKGIAVATEVRAITDGGHTAEEIIDLASQMRVDLVAMSTHGRSGVGRWVLGSVAERVLSGGDTHLLLVRVLGANIGDGGHLV